VFNDAAGQPLYSPGTTCLITPACLPSPVLDLKVSVAGDQFEGEWTKPRTGQVQVYALDAPPRYSPNEVIPFGILSSMAQVPSAGPTKVRDALNNRTELHLFPVTLVGGVVVAGKTVSTRWVPEVTDLSAQAQDDMLKAVWKWPKGVTTALLLVRHDQYATNPQDQAASQYTITQDQYNLRGGFQTPISGVEQVYLSVHAAVNRQGNWEYASGKVPGSRMIVAVRRQRTARYWVMAVRSWLMTRTGEYDLAIAPDAVVDLPELVLVGKPDGLPLDPRDGTVLARTPGQTTAGPHDPLMVRFRPPWPVSRDKVRLFPAHNDDYDWLELFSYSGARGTGTPGRGGPETRKTPLQETYLECGRGRAKLPG